jgi:fluoride ion exporter CrcB/FEX
MISFSMFCALGCLVRYVAEVFAGRVVRIQRLWATLAVNVFGSLLVGIASQHFFRENSQVLAFCGGMTSFSAAIAAPAHAWRDGPRRSAILVLTTTPLLCIAGYTLGTAL